MTVAAIFLKLANHSQPVSSGLALVLNSSGSLEYVECVVKDASAKAQSQAGATIESVLDAVKLAVEGKASVAELQVIALDTEIFA